MIRVRFVFATPFCVVLSALFALVCFGIVPPLSAQKPSFLKKNTDDKGLCNSANGTLKDAEYCENWQAYQDTTTPIDDRNTARNNMIELLRGQIDDYYVGHKNGRRLKFEILQQIFDVLEIGTATTIDFINGERAKSVLAAVLTGFQGSRSTFNKNFKVLQMQILINKMNADRDGILEQIYLKEADSEYTWLKAKSDLRQYLFAGTFGHAQDSLNEETGNAATNARVERETAEKAAGIKFAPSAEQTRASAKNLTTMRAITGEHYKLKDEITAEKAKAGGGDAAVIAAKEKRQTEITSQLQTMFGLIEGDPKLKPLLLQVPDEFSNNPASKLVLETSLQRIKDNKGATIDDYDSIFLKVGKLASSKVDQDPSINQRLKVILDTFK